MKKEKEEKEAKQKYVSKPNFTAYVRAIKEAKEPRERKALYKEQENISNKYATQQAKIKLGQMPSRSQAIVSKIGKSFNFSGKRTYRESKGQSFLLNYSKSLGNDIKRRVR